MTYVNLQDVLAALQETHFPAGREDLIRSAESARASQEVMSALRAIPPEQYGNRNEVARAVRVDPAEGLRPGAAG